MDTRHLRRDLEALAARAREVGWTPYLVETAFLGPRRELLNDPPPGVALSPGPHGLPIGVIAPPVRVPTEIDAEGLTDRGRKPIVYAVFEGERYLHLELRVASTSLPVTSPEALASLGPPPPPPEPHWKQERRSALWPRTVERFHEWCAERNLWPELGVLEDLLALPPADAELERFPVQALHVVPGKAAGGPGLGWGQRPEAPGHIYGLIVFVSGRDPAIRVGPAHLLGGTRFEFRDGEVNPIRPTPPETRAVPSATTPAAQPPIPPAPPAPTWAQVFRRSTIHPHVRVVADEGAAWHQIREWGLPVETQSGVFSSLYRSAAVLDGVVFSRAKYGMTGLPSGTRIIGRRAMWLFVHAFELRKPRQILGLADPGEESLRAELETQLADPDATKARAQWGLGVSDAAGVLELIERLAPGSVPELAVPSEWRASPFLPREARRLIAAGVDAAVAQSWAAAGLDLEWIVELGTTASLADVEEWAQLGLAATWAQRAIAGGIASGEVRRWMSDDITAAGAVSLILEGMSREDWRAYRDAGISQFDAAAFFRAGIVPAEARDWRTVGANGYSAAAFHRLGKNPDDVRSYRRAGVRRPLDWVVTGIPPAAAREWEEVRDTARPRMHGVDFTRLHVAGIAPRTVKRLWRKGHRSVEDIVRAADPDAG